VRRRYVVTAIEHVLVWLLATLLTAWLLPVPVSFLVNFFAGMINGSWAVFRLLDQRRSV